ncbi:hypothetical protein DXA59_06565 [Clostridium sp. OF03-18AA]|nr:hypothetical protein DXA59_06565 [Clostridium sp. OF03-18AA]
MAGVRGELPGRGARDAGMVPLSLHATAKGGEQGTQLASLKQVSPILQRSYLRAKRNQIPGSRRPSPEAHRWESSVRGEGASRFLVGDYN